MFEQSIKDLFWKSVIDRFWSHVDKKSTNECWNWIGGKTGDYGRFYIAGNEYIAAHHFVYLLNHGSIPEGKEILHSCDNPTCCNNSHLRLGTQLDNINDKKLRNRHPKMRITTSDDLVNIIRYRWQHSLTTQAQLAKDYNLNKKTIYNIINYKTHR